MPRKRVPIVAVDPYHITARCINKEWFTLPLETVWSVMEDHLYLLNRGFEIDIHGFVLMSNHFHLLLTASKGNLSEALLYFMRETSKEITRLSGRINQTYGNSRFDQPTLDWLNRPVAAELEKEMRLALTRPKFELTANYKTGRPSSLESELL